MLASYAEPSRFNYARQAIALACTPISSEDRDTRAVFGDYVHIYDIGQAVKDGATVPIYYESRLAKLELTVDGTPHIDEEVDEQRRMRWNPPRP